MHRKENVIYVSRLTRTVDLVKLTQLITSLRPLDKTGTEK